MARTSSFCPLLFAAATAVAQGPALTIYDQEFAVVRDRVALDLGQGTNDVRFAGVTAMLAPDSVVLRDPTDRVPLTIVAQSYHGDAPSQAALLSLHEGKELDFLVSHYWQGAERIVRGRLIRAGYGVSQDGTHSPIVEVEGKLRFGLPGTPLFPSLGDDTTPAPLLHWRLHAATAAQVDAELSYVTGGLTWQARRSARSTRTHCRSRRRCATASRRRSSSCA